MANAFGGRAPPGPIGGASMFPPDLLAAIGGGVLLLRGRGKGRRGEGRERGKGNGEGSGGYGEKIASSLLNFWLRA